jgi:hypothetical protein
MGIGKALPKLQDRIACEAAVDARAAEWVGRAAMRTMLYDVGREIKPFLAPEVRDYNAFEVMGRIAALDPRGEQGRAP